MAATAVVPLPAKGSNIKSPGFDKSWIKKVGKATGNTAGWPLLPASGERCKTFVGNTHALFFQANKLRLKPLPVADWADILYEESSFFTRLIVADEAGIFTAS